MISRSAVLIGVRYGLPLLLVVVGIGFLAAGGRTGTDAGLMFIGCAGVVIVANVLFRIGASGDAERQAEEDARTYFDQHGHWPDEAR